MRDYTPRPKPEKQPKKAPVALKRTAIKKKKVKPEKALLPVFLEIWIERQSGSKFEPREYKTWQEWYDHAWKYRVCAVTYEPITHFFHWNYAHVLARQFTRLREKKHNIGMLQGDVHRAFDAGTREEFLKLGPGAKWWLEYHDYLKSKYRSYEK